ncbi:hypothetical protein EEJ42_04670 [Streptomyces botrytidirepellens]|uniref:Uncharacterized protein n=1 Tax=Streptomyces botrytidirepellens TaxID=2486417 RepID=A0A3M8X1H0_9ACTN|nr:hypothetical protein EEJ42_04670 [Streptomyces botrytidirepellens]
MLSQRGASSRLSAFPLDPKSALTGPMSLTATSALTFQLRSMRSLPVPVHFTVEFAVCAALGPYSPAFQKPSSIVPAYGLSQRTAVLSHVVVHETPRSQYMLTPIRAWWIWSGVSRSCWSNEQCSGLVDQLLWRMREGVPSRVSGRQVTE